MRTPQRILAFGVLAAFTAAVGGTLFQLRSSAPPEAPLPPLLAAAHANPAEIGFQDTLRAGETISELLARADLASLEAHALLGELQDVHDPRRLRPGSVISYRKSFETGTIRGMELRIDADRTLNMRRRGESWAGSVEEVPVRADSVVLSGTVESSLYSALVNGDGEGVPAAERRGVADVLADRIFAWQLDFSRDLRPGDRFRILYERMVRPDGTSRASRVLGVQFDINDHEYDAYLYRSPDGWEDYYSADGESLRRAFLRAPLEFRRISSAFSTSRFHPVLKRNRPHWGIDYAASSGTPVRAVGDGVIRKAGWGNGYGNVVEISHKRGYSSRYAHLRAFAKGLRSGSRVKQGDLVGYVGATGLATAPHLHYEFHAAGRPVNPNAIKFITGDPVAGRYRSGFRQLVRSQVALMDRASGSTLLASGDAPSDLAGD